MSINSYEMHDVVERINDLLASGELTGIYSVETNGFPDSGFVTVRTEASIYRRDFTADQAAIDVITRAFPGGSVQRLHVAHRGSKLSLRADKARYSVDVGPVLLRFEYHVPHECQDFVGKASMGGTPKWWCNGCKRPVTTTAARSMGLLPPLVRKGAK
ncbi:hypothetical protein HYP71_gp055 [Arthrobacter phage KBurrousTX]|uniref:Uncharacterized protein n=1 Tax=Arthrobacter phage KBurrousTX TaxID=2315608 RepID=A0A386K8G6_9CAUD|nr:hypothetical protein HYP71_gp055 [Arthrobacter phage KBurrousTX]AYD81549.1 hypothetical protein KBurrousTX_55 [Arthrobacter phage KBurrousTX]